MLKTRNWPVLRSLAVTESSTFFIRDSPMASRRASFVSLCMFYKGSLPKCQKLPGLENAQVLTYYSVLTMQVGFDFETRNEGGRLFSVVNVTR